MQHKVATIHPVRDGLYVASIKGTVLPKECGKGNDLYENDCFFDITCFHDKSEERGDSYGFSDACYGSCVRGALSEENLL